MKKFMRQFFIALNFLTQIPSPVKGEVSQSEIGQSMLFYPLVGAVIGGVLYLLTHILLFFSTDFPPELLAAIVLSVWVLITGGLHLDGLSDSADAWIGGLEGRDKTLTIMKDPNCGPMGVVIIVLVLLLKWTALSYLLKNDLSAFLIVVPMLSRSLILSLFMTTLYVRESGLGTAFIEDMPPEAHLWTALLGSALVYWLFASFFSLFTVILCSNTFRLNKPVKES